jgi:DNA gyrase subunit B
VKDDKNENQFLFTDDELAKVVKLKEKEKGIEIAVDAMKDGKGGVVGFHVVEIFESHDLAKVIKKLDKFELTLQDYAKPTEAVNFELGSEKSKYAATSLADLLNEVKRNGKEGMGIQRYKGLGEMNPSQLWETTMDPQRRTMMKVTLEDTVEADRIFNILMGDQVEPRREFIAHHSKSVRNLDI